METINEKIRRLRNSKGISQAEVAKTAGINQASYSNIEKPIEKGGTKSISIEVGKGIAKVLGVSFNELFDIEMPNNSNESELNDKNEQLKKRIGELESQVKDKEELYAISKEANENYRLTLSVNERMLKFSLKNQMNGPRAIYTVSDIREIAIRELQKEMPEIFGDREYNGFTGQFQRKRKNTTQ